MQTTDGAVEISDSLKEVISELNNPQTAAALKNLLKNAQTLDAIVSGLDGFLRRGDEIVENAAESIREFAPKNGHSAELMASVPEFVGSLPTLARTGTKIAKIAETDDFDQLIQADKIAALKDLSDKLVNPITLNALNQLIDNAETLAFLVMAVRGFLGRSDEIVENVASTLHEFRPKMSDKYAANFAALLTQLPEALPTITENLPPLLEKAPILMQTTAKLGDIAESEGIQAFLNSGMLTPELVTLLGDIGKTTVETEKEFRANPKSVSLFGMLSATKNDDVQRGLGFLVALAGNIGKKMKS